MNLYILVGHTPVLEPDVETWARWFETGDWVVARTEVSASEVSTIFLGRGHNFRSSGPPLLFETAIFTGDDVEIQGRCTTWLEAEAQHQAAVRECLEKP